MAQARERYVQVERGHDGVAVVHLDRPKTNALSIEMVRQLTVVAEGLVDDPPGAVVLWGGRLLFAAGADITELVTDEDGLIPPEAAMAVSDGWSGSP